MSFLEVCAKLWHGKLFSKVIHDAGTREAFRPLIRIKTLDLLFTTSTVIEWWKEERPVLMGLILLIVLSLAASPGEGQIKFEEQSILQSIANDYQWPSTQWSKVYESVRNKYPDEIRPKRKGKVPRSYAERRIAMPTMPFQEMKKLKEKYRKEQ